MSAHAPLAPSSASRRMQCPGSRALCEQYPEAEDSPKSIEGTLAHAVCAAMVKGEAVPEGTTEEMLDGAELWLDCVALFKDELHIEELVKCQWVHPDNWGTPDAWAWDEANRTLYVWDYKFGHRYVEVDENWQLLNYAAGIIESLKLPQEIESDVFIILTIVQPRSYHRDGPVRTWSIYLTEAMRYFEQLQANALESMTADAPTRVGPECRDCSARHACPTLQKSAYAAVEFCGENTPFDLPDDAIGRELSMLRDMAEVLSHRISGLEDEVLGRITRMGSNIPGWMTEQGQGRERWARPIEEVLALGAMMGIDISKPGTLTPKQAIKAGLSADLVRTYSETPAGEVKLVRDTGNKARKVFG